jgi:hypothetical protein
MSILLITSAALATGSQSLRSANVGTHRMAQSRSWPCPEGSLYGQASKTSADPDWSAFTSAVTTAFTYKCYDTFSGVSGNIGDIHFWGLSLRYAAGWSACDPTGVPFEVTFYAPGAAPPTTVVSGPYTVTPSFVVVDNVLGFNLYYFSVPALLPPCTQAAGWVSIQSLTNTGDCAFLWFDSYDGALNAYQEGSGALLDNLAFCLTGEYVPIYGACCIDAAGDCQDNFDMVACMQAGGRFAANTLCANLEPPCGELPGACCYDNGYCTQVTAIMCGSLLGDANCDGSINFDDINAFVWVLGGSQFEDCPRGNCDTNHDGLVNFDDINSFVDLLSTQEQIHGLYLGGGTPCSACPCIVPCPPSGTPEGEPCNTDTNGGCNSSPFVWGYIACGETVCGTAYFDGYTRDTDWFIVTGLTGANEFTVTANAEFDLQLLFMQDTGNDCVGYTYVVVTAAPCNVATITTDGLPLDTFYIWVGPQFTTTFGCTEGETQYTVHLACEPVASGACCKSGICREAYTPAACLAINGEYMGDNTLCSEVTCTPAPQGETCADPFIVDTIPYDVFGETCSYSDDYDEVCPYGGSTSPDVAYSFTPSADIRVDINLCIDGSDYDTKLYVYEGGCPGTLIACNDDMCSSPQYASYVSRLPNVQLNGGTTYYIIVDGYGGQCGNYHMTITELGPCAECPPNSTPEGELCNTDTNGGCNSSPFVWGYIACGETICGTAYFDGYTRDTDWFIVSGLTGANQFTVTAAAEFDLQLLFMQDTGNDCVGYTYSVATAPACLLATIVTAGLPLDTYYIWVGPQFTTTFACTEGDPQYWVNLACTPVASGACCRGGICYDGYTADACQAFGGEYQGDNTLCVNITCPEAPPGENCSDPRIIAAVPYTDADNTCGYVLDCPASCGANNAPDVVYKWTPSVSGVATATTCNGSTFDTVLHVQTTCCGGDIVCNDDYCGLQSQVSWDASAGVDYYIIVSGYSTACGSYVLDVTAAPPPIGACCVALVCVGDMTAPECGNLGGSWYQGQSCASFSCPVTPPNDLCANAEAIVGPYPVTVNGTCILATLDCPGVLNWNAVWYKVTLPNALNNVTVTYCGTSEAIGTVGIVYYNMCDDCPNYVITTGYAWNSCSFGGGYGIDMYWNGVTGPRDIWIPAYVVNAVGAGIDFSATYNVVPGTPGPQAPTHGAPAISPITKKASPVNVTGAKAQTN